LLAYYEEILEKKKTFSCHMSVLDFLKLSSGTLSLPPVLLNTGNDDPDDCPAIKQEVPPA
jgi:hypothetical protein